MVTKAPKITNAGEALLTRSIGGEQITFTRFKIGNGSIVGDGDDLTDLINPLLSFGISSVDDTHAGFITVNGHFDNSDIESDFQFRELGIFAQGEDETEVLYAYANDGDNGGMLKANDGDVIAEQDISLVVAIGEAENVTAIITPGTIYAAKADFDAHVANVSNPHGVTKAQVGLGDVPNVTTNNQAPTYTEASELADLSSGEVLSTAFGKVKKAISSLISHLSNTSNPHSVTRAQIGAAASSHNHSASDINSGSLAVGRGGTGATTAAGARANLGAQADSGRIYRSFSNGDASAVIQADEISIKNDENPLEQHRVALLTSSSGADVTVDGQSIVPKHSSGTKGYKIVAGDATLQWGTVSVATTSTVKSKDVDLPTGFDDVNYAIAVFPRVDDPSQFQISEASSGSYTRTKTWFRFNYINTSSAAVTVTWAAFGKTAQS